MQWTRRGFLRGLGAGTTTTWLGSLLPRSVFAQESIREPFDPRITQQFASVCRQCPEGCGVLTELVNGKVKKLRGNPLHPTNRGTLCPRGLAATQLYYNPDRIPQPLQRVGARGDGAWEAIGWDAALGRIAEQLRALRDNGQSHTLAVLSEQLGGLERVLARRFCRAYGTPNFLDLGRYPTEGLTTAATAMQGVTGPVLFDIKNATYLLSFGVPFLETSRNPVQTWQHFAEFRRGAHRPRGRFVHFAPARDLTASKADEWIPIRPGTEAAVALGMAYVMLQEGLYDHDFIRFHAHGFTDWREQGQTLPGFDEHVRRNYKPAQVADISGVRVEKLVALAREFALAAAPLALWHEGAGVAAQSLGTQMAIHSLNALAGNIDRAGGILVPRALPEDLSPVVVEDAVATQGLSEDSIVAAEHTPFTLAEQVPSAFAQRVVFGSPYAINMAVIYRANPVFDQLSGAQYREALAKIPFSVYVGSFHNETTQWADLVLPEHHALEAWYAGVNYTNDGHPIFSLAEPVVPPRHDTMHFGDVLLSVAAGCGGSVAESLPWERFQDVAAAYLTEINALRSGDTFGRSYQEIWTRLLERLGWRSRADAPDRAFWEDCLRSGGWWDPVYFHKEWKKSLRTQSGRFEFLPAALWTRVQQQPGAAHTTGADASQLLPQYRAMPTPAAQAEETVLLLVAAMPNLADVESPNQPWLQEISGSQERQQWRTWIEVNPHDANHWHVQDEEDVWVESERGGIRAQCRYSEGVQPGTVRVPFGLGHTDGGRWMKDIGATPAAIVTPAYDPQIGTPLWQTTRVRVRKA